MSLACLWRTRSSVLGQLHLRPNALAAAGWGAVSLGATLHAVVHVACPIEVCPCGPASSLPHQYVLRYLHCNWHCGGMRRHCGGTLTGCGGTSAREKAHRRRCDAPAPLAWEQGSREIAQDSDDGVGASVPKLRADGRALSARRQSVIWIAYFGCCLLSTSPHVEG